MVTAWFPPARLAGCAALAFSCVLWASSAAVAAGRKPVSLTPEERHIRSLLQPLRDSPTQPETLQPLLTWIDVRVLIGEDRKAERDLRRILGRIHDEFHLDLQDGVALLRILNRQRSTLYEEVSKREVRAERGLERYRDFLPVPRQETVIPSLLPLPENLLRDVESGATSESGLTTGLTPEAGMAGLEEDPIDTLDAQGLMNRLTDDMTALSQLLHTCQSEYEREQKRHKYALVALETIFKARRNASRPPAAERPRS